MGSGRRRENVLVLQVLRAAHLVVKLSRAQTTMQTPATHTNEGSGRCGDRQTSNRSEETFGLRVLN